MTSTNPTTTQSYSDPPPYDGIGNVAPKFVTQINPLPQPQFLQQQLPFNQLPLPQQPTFIPQQPTFIPQQPTFIPQQPTFVTPQPSYQYSSYPNGQSSYGQQYGINSHYGYSSTGEMVYIGPNLHNNSYSNTIPSSHYAFSQPNQPGTQSPQPFFYNNNGNGSTNMMMTTNNQGYGGMAGMAQMPNSTFPPNSAPYQQTSAIYQYNSTHIAPQTSQLPQQLQHMPPVKAATTPTVSLFLTAGIPGMTDCDSMSLMPENEEVTDAPVIPADDTECCVEGFNCPGHKNKKHGCKLKHERIDCKLGQLCPIKDCLNRHARGKLPICEYGMNCRSLTRPGSCPDIHIPIQCSNECTKAECSNIHAINSSNQSLCSLGRECHQKTCNLQHKTIQCQHRLNCQTKGCKNFHAICQYGASCPAPNDCIDSHPTIGLQSCRRGMACTRQGTCKFIHKVIDCPFDCRLKDCKNNHPNGKSIRGPPMCSRGALCLLRECPNPHPPDRQFESSTMTTKPTAATQPSSTVLPAPINSSIQSTVIPQSVASIAPKNNNRACPDGPKRQTFKNNKIYSNSSHINRGGGRHPISPPTRGPPMCSMGALCPLRECPNPHPPDRQLKPTITKPTTVNQPTPPVLSVQVQQTMQQIPVSRMPAPAQQTSIPQSSTPIETPMTENSKACPFGPKCPDFKNKTCRYTIHRLDPNKAR